MENRLLGRLLETHALLPHLPNYCGGADINASSNGAACPPETLLLGDTQHDLELPQAIGCRAVLFFGGHQSRERLVATGAPVVDHLDEVAGFLIPRGKVLH